MTVEEAMGSLKAHEERVKGKTDTSETRLMLTDEEGERKIVKKENCCSHTKSGSNALAKEVRRDKVLVSRQEEYKTKAKSGVLIATSMVTLHEIAESLDVSMSKGRRQT